MARPAACGVQRDTGGLWRRTSAMLRGSLVASQHAQPSSVAGSCQLGQVSTLQIAVGGGQARPAPFAACMALRSCLGREILIAMLMGHSAAPPFAVGVQGALTSPHSVTSGTPLWSTLARVWCLARTAQPSVPQAMTLQAQQSSCTAT